MALNVLYLRPQEMKGNGVRAYSERVLEACARYGDGRYRLVDFSPSLESVPLSPGKTARLLGERAAAALRRDSCSLVFAEMGVGEFQVFHALRGLKEVAPGTPTLVTVHDPPRTVVNLNPRFYPHQALTAVRGARWLYNRTLGQSLEREFLGQGHHWLVLSEQGRRLWGERLKACGGKGECGILPHLNYSESPDQPEWSGQPESSDRVLRLGVLGSIAKSKGIDLLIEALHLLAQRGLGPQELALEVAGAPLFRQDQRHLVALKDQVARLSSGEQVTFSGYLPEQDIADFFARIDLLVLPYRDTGSGSASGPLMWARSFGVPVVASRTRNLPELVRHGEDGLLCTPGDSRALADALQAACAKTQLARLRAGAAKRREESSWPVFVSRLGACFDAVRSAQAERGQAPFSARSVSPARGKGT